MSFSLYIAKRYLFSKSRNNTINIITLMATLGVIVGTLALFVVLSGFSGLREFSLRLLNTSDPDISIAAVQGKSFIFNQGLQDIIAEQADIASYTKVIEERVLLEFNSQSQVAFIKGVDNQYTQVNRMDTTVYDGDWLSKEIPAGAVVGNGISNSLSIGAYDVMAPLSIFVPKPGKGYTNRPEKAFNQIKVQPIGVFSITEETDQKYVFISLEMAQELLSYTSDQVSGIELKLHNPEARSVLAQHLQNRLGKSFKVQTREQLNAVFYKMLHK
ncbi:MAG: ABC transporter permease, partial [Lutibacter sp.]|nr:ABC transporter permease [Lutibacter sp.]